MVWTGESFHKHNRGLSTAQSAHAARIANAVLRRSGDEGLSIATANKMARREDGGGLLTGEAPDPQMESFAAGGSSDDSPGLLVPGNIDLASRPVVKNRDGSISTVRSITVTDENGRAVLIPTVVGNAVVPNDEAVRHWRQTGEQLGMFDTIENADRYARQLHEDQAAMYAPGYAAGGMTAEPGSVAPNLTRSGLLHSPVPGRTDHIAAKPAAGSYVIPADVTSGVGEGNTLAGGRVLQSALGIGPFGVPLNNPRSGAGARSRFSRPPPLPRVYKDGGHTDKRDGVECLLAGGEFVVAPEDVLRLGGGNMKRGHRILDELVVHLRKQIIDQMKKLPPPVGSKKA